MQFVGLTNYYRKFVKSYAAITVPLYELLKKDTPFVWGEQQQAAFEALKAALTEAPLLMLPRPDKPYEMHTDASDFAIGAVLYQEDAVSGELRPIAYESHKLSEVQRRYATHERELLAVVHALKVWRMYLVGCPVTRHCCTAKAPPRATAACCGAVTGGGGSWVSKPLPQVKTPCLPLSPTHGACNAMRSRLPSHNQAHKQPSRCFCPCGPSGATGSLSPRCYIDNAIDYNHRTWS